MAVWSQLVEVRFKLLALVPVVTGAGIGLLGNVGNVASLRVTLVATLGLATVIALMAYDLRNSILHDIAVHRLKTIERSDLKLNRSTRSFARPENARPWSERKWPEVLKADKALGGVFADRPASVATLFGIRVQHDRALALVYIASATAWVALVAYSALGRLTDLQSNDVLWWTLAIAVGAAFALLAAHWWYGATARYVIHVLTSATPSQPWGEWDGSQRPQGRLAATFVARATQHLHHDRPPDGDREHNPPTD